MKVGHPAVRREWHLASRGYSPPSLVQVLGGASRTQPQKSARKMPPQAREQKPPARCITLGTECKVVDSASSLWYIAFSTARGAIVIAPGVLSIGEKALTRFSVPWVVPVPPLWPLGGSCVTAAPAVALGVASPNAASSTREGEGAGGPSGATSLIAAEPKGATAPCRHPLGRPLPRAASTAIAASTGATTGSLISHKESSSGSRCAAAASAPASPAAFGFKAPTTGVSRWMSQAKSGAAAGALAGA